MKLRAWLAACALVACGGATPAPQAPRLWGAVRPEWGPPQPGDAAPELVLPRTLEDGTLSLSSLRGGWVLLHFTATWCPFCDAEIAALGKLADEYGARNVKVVLVGVEEPLDRWTAYAKERVHPPLIALHDLDGKTASRFAPPKLQPSFKDRAETILAGSLIIDPSGTIRLFVIADSVHYDSKLSDVRGELDRFLGGGHGAATVAGTTSDEVVVKTSTGAVKAARSGHGELVVTIDIANGWHVMSNRPSKPEYIATVLDVAADGVRFGEPIYPAPQMFDVAGSAISTFEGHVTVRVPFEVESDATVARHAVKAHLRYQSCTRASCRFPRTDAIDASIDVE